MILGALHHKNCMWVKYNETECYTMSDSVYTWVKSVPLFLIGSKNCLPSPTPILHVHFRYYHTSPHLVHRCGASGCMRACHAAGPGSIPGRDRFPGWGFFRGFSSPVRQMLGSFRPLGSPNIIWPSLSSILIHYGHQWPEMLTRPTSSNNNNSPHLHFRCFQ